MKDLKEFFQRLSKKYPNCSLVKDLKLIKNLNSYTNILISDKFFNNIDEIISCYDNLSYPSITCGIMTYNEERCIKRCISSLYNEFDEIILLDSMSTDNTLNIVNSNFPKVKILKESWKDDFSYNRNIIINNASSDWIYFIDADNIYSNENKGKAKRIAKLITFFEIDCVISPIIYEHNNTITYDNRRLFSLRKNIIFFGKVHEEPLYYDKILPKNITADIKVYHDGYNSQIINQDKKNKRNIILTKKMMDIEPSNPKWLYFYAKELYFLNEKNNQYIYTILIKCLNLYKSSNYYRYYGETISLLCEILFKLNKFNELNNYVDLLEKIFPNCADISYYRGCLIYLDIQNRIKKLLDYLNPYVNDNTQNTFSIIQPSNDHLKSLIISLLISLQDFNSIPKIYNNIDSKELKEKILKSINTLNIAFSAFDNKTS